MPGPMDMMMGGGPGGGMPPGMPGGMPPGGGPPPAPPTDPTAQLGLSAMSQLNTPNPTAAVAQVDQAMGLAYQLLQKTMPQVIQWNPKVAKELHDISRRLVSAQMEIRKDVPSFGAPPDMGTMDTAGLPPSGPLAGTGM